VQQALQAQQQQLREAVHGELDRARVELEAAQQALGSEAGDEARASLRRSQERLRAAQQRAARGEGRCAPPRRAIVKRAAPEAPAEPAEPAAPAAPADPAAPPAAAAPTAPATKVIN
jgi:hypothetical protein